MTLSASCHDTGLKLICDFFPWSHGVPGGTTVLVELTPDIHICGICKQQFSNLDAFVAHKQSGCQLTSTPVTAPSTVQFVSEETVPATQTQTTTRTISSETQTITGTAGQGKGRMDRGGWLHPPPLWYCLDGRPAQVLAPQSPIRYF